MDTQKEDFTYGWISQKEWSSCSGEEGTLMGGRFLRVPSMGHAIEKGSFEDPPPEELFVLV